MRTRRFEIVLGTVLLALYAAFWLWQTPGVLRGPLAADEIDAYLAGAERNLAMPADEKARSLAKLRAWAQADDGQPVYMLNLMRHYPELLRFEGAPAFAGTPAESNAIYEQRVMPLLFGVGGYPLVGGPVQGANLIVHEPALDHWSRLLVVRYPSRRAFLDLVTHTDYGPIEPYKLMALEVVLTPTRGEVLIPELRWTVGLALLVVFLLACLARRRG
jgi:hypothetical protein